MKFPGPKQKSEPAKALTSAEWQQRIAEVERQIAQTQQALEAKREERRGAAGSAIIFGSAPDFLTRTENEEREVERKLDSLVAALEFARAELQKSEAAALEEQRKQRRAVTQSVHRCCRRMRRSRRLGDQNPKMVRRRTIYWIGKETDIRPPCLAVRLAQEKPKYYEAYMRGDYKSVTAGEYQTLS